MTKINLQELTERRKADRAELAKQIKALAQEFGCAIVVSPVPGDSRGINIDIEAARGLCVSLNLSGASIQPDIHVLPWHIRQGDAKLAAQFGYVGGEVNPYHWRKCTSVSRGSAALMRDLRLGLQMAREGSAFQ